MNLGRFNRLETVIALVVILAGSPADAAAGNPGSGPGADHKVAAQASRLIEKAHREGPQRLIVGLDSAFIPEGKLGASARAAQRRYISGDQSAVLAGLAGHNVVERRRFQFIPYVVLWADARAIERLATMPRVSSLEEDRMERPVMASSNQVIGSPAAWDLGYDGSDWAVAVLDTGVDRTHPFFATQSKIVSEACYSSTDEQQKSTTVCPDGRESSTAIGSGVNCPAEVDGCDHGTHVAGSVAGNDQAGPNFGVARGAHIIAIQVFSSVDNASTCGGNPLTPCVRSFVSDQLAALERVYALRNEFNIAAVNMSLGGRRYTDQAECDLEESSRQAAIENLRSVGIATIAASGNSDSRDSIATPACLSSSISVAATTDADQVAGFSNVAEFLDLLAPGSSITSSVPGGGLETWRGTSMAAPHVAGAWGVLRQKYPEADVAGILEALRDTGTRIDDDRSDGTVTDMRRINLDQALLILDQPLPGIETNPVSGASIDFGRVAVGSVTGPLNVQVHNPGNADLSLNCSLDGSGAGSFSIESCPATVLPDATIEVSLVCQPGSAGTHEAALLLESNDPDEPQLSFALLCVGTAVPLFSDGFEVSE